MSRSSKDTLRILVIDDCKDVADSLATLIGLWGYETCVAYNGPEAMSAADDFRPHIVLMDLIMPDMSGTDLARTLRQQPGLEHAVMIAISGHGKEIRKEYWDSPLFETYFVKPVEPTELRRVLQAEEAWLTNDVH